MTDIEGLIARVETAMSRDRGSRYTRLENEVTRSILSALESMRWVAVEERLPTDSGDKWVVSVNGLLNAALFDYRQTQEWYTTRAQKIEVSYWMDPLPLPAPPKVET